MKLIERAMMENKKRLHNEEVRHAIVLIAIITLSICGLFSLFNLVEKSKTVVTEKGLLLKMECYVTKDYNTTKDTHNGKEVTSFEESYNYYVVYRNSDNEKKTLRISCYKERELYTSLFEGQYYYFTVQDDIINGLRITNITECDNTAKNN